MLGGSYAAAEGVLDRSYTQKEIAPQGKICSEVIFGQNHLKGCVARWIRIMALAGVLCVSGLFGHIHHLT